MSNRLVRENGTLIEGFEDVDDWTIAGTGALVANDSDYHRTGSQGLRVTSANGTSAYASKQVNIDLSAVATIKFSIYINDASLMNNIVLYLSNAWGTTTNSMQASWAVSYLTYGWNEMVIPTSDFSQNGTGTFSSNILMIRMRVGAAVGETTWATWDNLVVDYDAIPVVIFTFDDGYDTQINNAYPVLNGNGQKASVYPYKNSVGAANKMTEANLASLNTAGWDIGNHGETHVDFTTITATQIADEIDNMADYLDGLGYSSTSRHVAYPYGGHDWNVYSVARGKTRTGRITGNVGHAMAHIEDGTDSRPWFIKGISVLNSHSTATLTGMIDDVIADKGVLVFVFHNIVDTDADVTSKYLTADFTTVSNYVKTKTDAGDLRCMTMSEYEAKYLTANRPMMVRG